uniref:Skp1_POZ domain-containing protein n=1 Tax=Rhabditophanes sp. KR3021 TaxID=114890 RepID=A0AC35UFX1_9BILA
MNDGSSGNFKIITKDDKEYSLTPETYKRSEMLMDMLKNLSLLDDNDQLINTDYERVKIEVNEDILNIIASFCKDYAVPLDMPIVHVSKYNELDFNKRTFAESLTIKDVFCVIMAADYLEMKELVNVMCKRVSNYINSTNVSDIKKEFGSDVDST